jgi:hypothetical protein
MWFMHRIFNVMNMMPVCACYISLPVEAKLGGERAEKVLNDMTPVRVKNNTILNEMMAHYTEWDKSPLIWIQGSAYRLKVLEQSQNHATMLQQNVQINYKSCGKQQFKILTQRKVRIVFG